MPANLDLRDDALHDAAEALAAAAGALTGGGARPHGHWPSLTRIGQDVDDYLRGLCLARNALADAAKTSAYAASELVSDSRDLDAQLARELHPGFAIAGTA